LDNCPDAFFVCTRVIKNYWRKFITFKRSIMKKIFLILIAFGSLIGEKALSQPVPPPPPPQSGKLNKADSLRNE
jgi:hypothetical protein